MSRYRFVHEEKAALPVAVLCRVLRASRSGYYAWTRREVSARAQADAARSLQIAAAHARSRGSYGAPRIHAVLRAAGVRTSRRRRVRTTVADPAHTPAPNLVARNFAAPAPNRLWLGDITFVPTYEGWRSLAVLLDAHSRRVVGWAMADHLRTALALDPLAMALRARRPPPGLIHHTDRGCQYTAGAYQAELAARGRVCSMSRSGDCLDNAMAESFFATLKAELCDRRVWATRAAARTALFEWIEVFYNRQRAHSALAFQPPAMFEEGLLLSDHAA